MNNAKSEAESLLNAALPFAEYMLGKVGEFFPFARAFGPSRELISIMSYDGDERPPSDTLIKLLESGLRRGAETGEYVVTALVYDVRLTPQGSEKPTDAIAAELEHVDGYAVTVFFPYSLEDGSPTIGTPFATAATREIFAS